MKCIIRALVAIVVAAGLAAPAFAYDDPKYEYRKPEDIKVPKAFQYKANGQIGVLWTTGNSESVGVSGNFLAGLKHYNDAFELFVQGAYAEAGTSSKGDGGVIDGKKVAARNWLVRGRYDRYFLDVNTVFASFAVSGDELGGYDYRLEPQVGYARILYHSDTSLLRGELGYDYTFEHYLAGTLPRHKDFHSARAFLGVEHKLTPFATFLEGVEVLWAFNDINRFRINSLSSLSATISKRVTLKLNLTIKANFDPPPRPAAIGGNYGVLDTNLEAVLGITFL